MTTTNSNDNFGTLGKNRNPKSADSPPYTGSCQIDGKMYWISGRVRENKSDGSKFFALSFRPKDQKPDTFVEDFGRGAAK
jgi:hypothetical protein